MIRPLIFLFFWGLAIGISHPALDYTSIGGSLGLLGSFDSVAYYNQDGVSSQLSFDPKEIESDDSNKLYIRNLKHNTSKLFAETDKPITDIQVLSTDSVLVNGDFTEFNNNSCQPPIIYNITSKEITDLFLSAKNKRDDESSSLDGTVKVTYIDKDTDLIYLGGNFTQAAVVYNRTSKDISDLPFKGFGKDAIVNSIVKILDDDNKGSIIFGGDFDTLGLPKLLQLNTTKHHNSTNTSLITAEQKVSLKHGIFSDVNGDGSDPSKLICPSTSALWSPQDNSGAQWLVELPTQMKGLTPTKVRLYVPEGDDAVNLFRIYSYPNNGIMNLTYIDPETNDIKHCDAWCPLATLQSLKNSTDYNIDNYQDLADDFGDDETSFLDEHDGTYSTYYDGDVKTRTLSYAKNFQEFSFENDISIDQVGLTVISWYGSKGSLAGFELYLDRIMVYGNETLNEPNCNEDSNKSNLVEVSSGDFQSVQELDSSVTDSDYLVSVGTDGKIDMYPNITYSGDYSIIILTPGCLADDSCDKRSIVNVTMFDTDNSVLATKQIYQNNDEDKFDYLFYGHLEGSTLSQGQNKIEIEFDRPVIDGTSDPWMVVDKIRADIVELDNYYDKNSTNRTSSHDIELKIHGLFEYSLANFTSFDSDDYEVSPVGNSSINYISSQLSNDSVVNQLNYDNNSLVILGDFDTKSSLITNNNLIDLKVGDYNTTGNFSEVEIQKRELLSDFIFFDEDFELFERDDDIFGLSFNNSITTVTNYNNQKVLLGNFKALTTDDRIKIHDLSSDNDVVETANNFLLYNPDLREFSSFGNDYIDEDFDAFANVSINSLEFFVFQSSKSRQTWDNTNKEWITNPSHQLNISQVVSLSSTEQIISGSSFILMGGNYVNQVLLKDNSNDDFDTYDINLDNGTITNSYYISETKSVVAGSFKTYGNQSVVDIGFVDTKSHTFTGLNDSNWKNNLTVQSLYVDSKEKYLVIGYNGSVAIDGSDLSGGIIIYDLKKNAFTDFQPAELISDSNDLMINSIVLSSDSNSLLIGGKFSSAGSLDCENLCIYDIKNTRWESPTSGLSGKGVADIKFIASNEVLVAGDFKYKLDDIHFIIYNIKKDEYKTVDNLNKLEIDGKLTKIVMADDSYNDNLNGRFIAVYEGGIQGYDGKSWLEIDGIKFGDETEIADIKLLSLKGDSNSNDKYFDSDKILAVAGKYELDDYGLINLAYYNGSSWNPFIYTSINANELGKINTILVKDQYRFLSAQDLESHKKLSAGKVVGISLACALGSTTLLSLLYIVPYYILFRKNKDEDTKERIHERDMMDAVNPEELFHEIDLQRHH